MTRASLAPALDASLAPVRAASIALALGTALLSCAPRGAAYTLRIANRDTVAFDSAVVDGGDARWRAGTIAPGGEATVMLRLTRDRMLHLNGMRAGLPFRTVLGGFEGSGPGGTLRVVIVRGGTLDIGALGAP